MKTEKIISELKRSIKNSKKYRSLAENNPENLLAYSYSFTVLFQILGREKYHQLVNEILDLYE